MNHATDCTPGSLAVLQCLTVFFAMIPIVLLSIIRAHKLAPYQETKQLQRQRGALCKMAAVEQLQKNVLSPGTDMPKQAMQDIKHGMMHV